MNTVAVIAGAALLSAASVAVSVVALRPADSDSQAQVASRLESIAARIENMERASEEQNLALRRFEERLTTETERRNERAAANQLAAREAAMQQVPTNGAVANPTASEATPETAPAFDLNATFNQLLAAEPHSGANLELWEQIKKAGKLDEAIALFEQRAQGDPFNPDLKVDLASAYLQKIFEAGAGPAAGKWAMKVDGALDEALKLDEQHWEARFTKATSLSHWPAAFGKKGEAIRNFEILLEQQRGGQAQPHYAQTYLMLGNLYQDIGQGDKARDMWQAGADLFPTHANLRQQLQLNSGR